MPPTAQTSSTPTPKTTTAPTTLLTLPPELRHRIYTLALHPTSPHPDLSLLLTSHQLYLETRSLPLQLHTLYKSYTPSTPTLTLPSFQIASLKKLTLTHLYPTSLFAFTTYPNKSLFGLEGLSLDTLVIYTENWLGKANAGSWRNVASRGDVFFDLSRSARWLGAICGLWGWRQLEVEFREGDVEREYWERGAWVQALFEDFRRRVGDGDLDGNGEGSGKGNGEGNGKGNGYPPFTIWHKQAFAPFHEIITVLRTEDLHAHGSPEWRRGDLRRLREGRECVLAPEGEEGSWRSGFHVGERMGLPTARQGRCGWCAASEGGGGV